MGKEYPAQPEQAGRIDILGRALDVAIADSTVYIAAGAGGLWVLHLEGAVLPPL